MKDKLKPLRLVRPTENRLPAVCVPFGWLFWVLFVCFDFCSHFVIGKRMNLGKEEGRGNLGGDGEGMECNQNLFMKKLFGKPINT